MTPEQKQIMAILQANGGEVTKAQVVEAIGGDYYCNGSFHVGNSLSRMVNSGILIRVNPGVFKIGRGNRSKPSTADNNQISLEL